MLQSHEELIAWQLGYALACEIYVLTKKFPTVERYGLIAQMRRAAISIPSNIAEGYNRRTRKEYCQFCYIAFGSANELRTQLRLAKDLGMASPDHFQKAEQCNIRTLQVLHKLIGSLDPQKSDPYPEPHNPCISSPSCAPRPRRPSSHPRTRAWRRWGARGPGA